MIFSSKPRTDWEAEDVYSFSEGHEKSLEFERDSWILLTLGQQEKWGKGVFTGEQSRERHRQRDSFSHSHGHPEGTQKSELRNWEMRH